MIQRVDMNGGKVCAPGGSSNPCDGFQLSRSADSTLFDRIAQEALIVGGAPLNFYKLLGTTAINDPQNLTGFGVPISSPHIPGFDVSRIFTGVGTFRSAARGAAVTQDAFVGYDFGQMPLEANRAGVQRYAARIVSQLELNQSTCEDWTASKVRIERSDDGYGWKGVAVVDVVPGRGVYSFTSSTAARYWRVRPLQFNGAAANNFWEVTSLLLSESGTPELGNIEDEVLFENRAREYYLTPITLKGRFDHQDAMMEMFAHGMGLTQQMSIEVSFSQAVSLLGRPPVIGDIIEMPSEVMYDQSLNVVRKFVEVMDVAWSSTSYTPGWMPTMMRLMVSPAIASRETKQIFGATYTNKIDAAGVFESTPALEGAVVQEYDSIIDAIRSGAKSTVPQQGIDQTRTGQPTLQEQQDVAAKVGEAAVAPFIKRQTGFYVEDAMPPNGEPYTTGAELPATGIEGAYHRVIYTGTASDIPARLYRYSALKGRWIYLESDKRAQYAPLSPMVGDPRHK